MKIAAIFRPQADLDYLEASLRSIHKVVDLVLIGVAGTADPALADALKGLDLPIPIELARGNWLGGNELPDELAQALTERGFGAALVMDGQDVYAEEDLDRILAFAECHPEAGQFQVRVHHYWKNPRYRIDPPDPVEKTALVRLVPGAKPLAAIVIPEELGVCHNFTFAGPTTAVLRRLKSKGLPAPAAEQWRKSVWESWNANRMLRNLHPEQPARFRAAIRIQPALLPEHLANHASLQEEIAGETARPPVCSLVVAALDIQTARAFFHRLAVTVPDDCEIIVSSGNSDTRSAASSIPGVTVVAPAANSLLEAWNEGAAAARSRNLLFLTGAARVEGDWVEGFLAALEKQPASVVFLPRVLSAESAPGQTTSETLALSPATLFDRYRGRFHGRQSPAERPFNPENALCWACTRETLATLTEETLAWVLDDTIVFAQGSTVPGERPAPVMLAPDKSAPRATIVIPIFNNLRLTESCVDSIFRSTPEDQFELVIVDNGSTDGSWGYLQSLGQRARVIRNRRNLFFARGSNRGAWAARSEHIVFLNNDTIVSPGWLEELLRPLDNDPTIGITGNKQLFPASHPSCAGRVWHAGMVVGENRLPWHVCYGFDAEHPGVNRERECVSVSGCCLAIRRELFEELGGFDPYFQNGFEDVDLCLRARERGYKIVYAPKSEIVHMVSSSESRFDREAINQEKFSARWSSRLVPDEREFLKASGLLPDRTPPVPRVGFVSTFNQKGAHSRKAEELIQVYPAGSCVVLAEFGIHDRRPAPDALHVIRCWDRAGTWHYPLLRWATTLDLDLIHVHFEPALFPIGFVELLEALKAAGKELLFTLRETRDETPLLAGIARLADAVAVDSESDRRRLIRWGFAAWKIHVIPAADAQGYLELYRTIRSGAARPVRVRWEGPQLVNHSLALVNREMELALLRNERIALAITPVGPDTFADLLHSNVRALTHYYGRFLPRADAHVRHQWPPNWTPPAEGRWIVIQPWEYGGVPEEWIESINRDVDEVWAPSTFVRRLYIDSGADPDRVHVVPNGVDVELFRPGVRPYPLPSARRFKFLFLGGTIHRKGIDLLLLAYSQAFQASDDVSLVIKDMGTADVYQGQGIGARIRQMQSDSAAPHIVYLDRNLSDAEMAQLYNACDCLVHPYRGEGFALPVLEAMACGRPVVVTAGGATDDFVDDNVGYRIPAQRQVFGHRSISGLKTAGDLWLLEPDVDALRRKLIEIVNHPEGARETGMRARQKVESEWTWGHAARKAIARLEDLKTRPILRHLRRAEAAALIDVEDDRDIEVIVSSLVRNSYANLAIFARVRSQSSVSDLRLAFPEIEIVDDEPFSSVIDKIRTTVRAPFLALITQPCVFTRHWLQQLIEAAAGEEKRPRIVVPLSEQIESGEAAEASFQRRARLHWRAKRGSRRNVDFIPPGCVLMNWACLELHTTAPQSDANDWLAEMTAQTAQGVPIVQAEDTWIGLLPMPAVELPPGSWRSTTANAAPDSASCGERALSQRSWERMASEAKPGEGKPSSLNRSGFFGVPVGQLTTTETGSIES